MSQQEKQNFDEPIDASFIAGSGIHPCFKQAIRNELDAVRKIMETGSDASEQDKKRVCNFLKNYKDLKDDYMNLWDWCKCDTYK